jgi:hypothetical protein
MVSAPVDEGKREANRFLEYLLELSIGRGADNSHYVQ